MAHKPQTLPRRFGTAVRLIGDMIVLLLVGILWVPLHLCQERTVASEPCEIERISEEKRFTPDEDDTPAE